MTRFPLQPIVEGRFVANSIVRRLLDDGGFDLNDIAAWGVSDAELTQFAQLIGYPVNEFGELDYVDDDTYAAACQLDNGLAATEAEARIAALEETLLEIRTGLKVAAAAAFQIHPDDLKFPEDPR